MELKSGFFKFIRVAEVAAFFIIAGIIMTAIGGFVAFNANDGFAEATATITEISLNEGYGDESDMTYNVYVDYSVDGKEYTHIPLNAYSSDYTEGKEVKIEYNPENPEEISSGDMGFISYIIIGIGIVFLIIGVVRIVIGVKKNNGGASASGEYDDGVSMRNTQKSSGEDFSPPTTAGKKYFLKPDKHVLKQGVLMEDENNNLVYEALVKEFTVATEANVDFVNHISGRTVTHGIGHTVTTNEDSLSAYSRFTIDGKNIWDYLHENGIKIKTVLSNGFVNSEYTVSRYGKIIAVANTCGTNPHAESGLLSKIPAKGFLRVTVYDELDFAFLTAFAISRTDQVEYD